MIKHWKSNVRCRLFVFPVIPTFSDIFEPYLSSCSVDVVDCFSAHIFQLVVGKVICLCDNAHQHFELNDVTKQSF